MNRRPEPSPAAVAQSGAFRPEAAVSTATRTAAMSAWLGEPEAAAEAAGPAADAVGAVIVDDGDADETGTGEAGVGSPAAGVEVGPGARTGDDRRGKCEEGEDPEGSEWVHVRHRWTG